MELEKPYANVSRATSDSYLSTRTKSSVRELQNELFLQKSPRKTQSARGFYYLDGQQFRELDTPVDRVTSWFLKYKSGKEKSPYTDGLQAPRWPSECQVLDERVKHIPFTACPPEPFYHTTGREVETRPIGEEAGIIIYQYYPISAVDYFSRSSVGGSKFLLQTCPSPEESGLRFESRFESGNLAKAIKIHETYYELYLRHDMYTNRHMQWFYFRVSGMKKGIVYRFSFVNFTKTENLYSEGMKPLIYSSKDAEMHSVGWRRVGTNIAYFCNESNNCEQADQVNSYTLTFTFEFPHDDDLVYFAHSYPYTYTDLQEYLFGVISHPVKSTYTTLRLLCKTLAGNNVYYVTVTTPSSQCPPTKKKRAIVITARVHPGETPSSWIMQGIVDYLTSDCAPAKELRDNFLFKIVPMLNPDGVIVGNHRCSLMGRDLNRQYRTVIREYYPSIWYTKLMIKKLVEECGVAMYCDLHAHSKRNNIFIFGCENRKNSERKLYEQVFPLMLHKNAPEKFSFQHCKFRVQKCKEGTGRVVMWMMGIANSFTLEASFAGSTLGSRNETHFNTLDFELMGKTFCQTLLDYYDDDPRKEKLRAKIMHRLLHEGSSADEPANINISDYSTDEGEDSSSSTDNAKSGETKPMAPPSTPEPIPERRKSLKVTKSQSNVQNKVPVRTPLRVRKANLDLMTWKGNSEDSSDSCSESSPKTKKSLKKKKKKRHVKKQLSDVHIGREIKANEFLPEKILTKAVPKKLRAALNQQAQRKFVGDVGYTPQVFKFVAIQNKLLSLKNKLWFGVGDMDPRNPLSWGLRSEITPSSMVESHKSERRKDGQKKTHKHSKDKSKEMKPFKEEGKLLKRPREMARKQTAIDQFNERKLPYQVIKMHFESKLPIEVTQMGKLKKTKKKKASKSSKLPND